MSYRDRLEHVIDRYKQIRGELGLLRKAGKVSGRHVDALEAEGNSLVGEHELVLSLLEEEKESADND